MRIHSIDLIRGKHQIFRIRRRSTFGIINGEIKQHRSKYPLLVQFDGYNILVTDQGMAEPILVAEQELTLNNPRIWLEGQELVIEAHGQDGSISARQNRQSKYLLTWDLEKRVELQNAGASSSSGSTFQLNPANLSLLGRLRALPSFLLTSLRMRLTTPLERVAPRLAAILVALIFAALVSFLWRMYGKQRNEVEASVIEPTPTVTAVPTERPVSTQIPIRTPNPTSTWPPTVVRIANPLDVPPSTVEATQTQIAVARSLVTNTPIPCLVPTPLAEGFSWDTNLDKLGIEVVRTCAQPGEQFWQLIEARWLDPAESNGYHHVFVDAVDEEMQRVLQPPTSFVMRWPTDECKRYIKGRGEPFGHGEHCPMYATGRAYDVTIQGLPSDIVRGLGLGSPEQRDWRILGSYHLVFQRKTLTR